MFLLTQKIFNVFSKWSKPKPKLDKVRQIKRSFSAGDEKAAKLSKSQQEQENKIKLVEKEKIEKQTIRKIAFMKTHDVTLEEFKTQEQLDSIKYHQHLYLQGVSKGKKGKQPQPKPKPQVTNFEYLPTEASKYFPDTQKYKRFEPIYGNYTNQINKRTGKYTQFAGTQQMRRMGTLGVKMGMTTLWDKWGDMVPVTIVLLDRVQVVQIVAPNEGKQFYQVQMGIGDRSIKGLSKSELGHFMKANVPPKKEIASFQVSKECLLPVGYMMSARHYTPGMFVDVVGKTVGHGFSGTIKRYNFRRQPETHGNSLTTRVLGSTGGRQDPGRVFKQKKMYGRMGGYVTVQEGMTVFKIDVQKNILYIKGSLPGKAGTIYKIRDTLGRPKAEKNMQIMHFPTFVEEEGKQYAKQFSMYCGERDPDEIEVHDNAYILDEDESASNMDDAPAKDAIPDD